ncbi:MAG: leucyl aminopeptidase [Rhodoglobus sp.]|nr:leucyl aminopeptidase [Rhodoglobus sp.]
MTVPALSTSALPLLEIEGDVLVLGVRKTDEGPQLATEDPALADLQLALEAIGVTGAQDEVRRLPGTHGATESIALVGLGQGEVTANDLRYAAGSAARQLRGIQSLVLGLPTRSADDVLAVLEGAALGAYAYTPYRASSLEATKLPATSIIVATDAPRRRPHRESARGGRGGAQRARPRERTAERHVPGGPRRRGSRPR